MIEPYRGLEYHAFHGWRPLANEFGNNAGIRCALAAPDPFTCSADRDCGLFHRHVETNIFFHGCSPFDAWARRPVASPYFHPIGEQPLIQGNSLPRLPHVDGAHSAASKCHRVVALEQTTLRGAVHGRG